MELQNSSVGILIKLFIFTASLKSIEKLSHYYIIRTTEIGDTEIYIGMKTLDITNKSHFNIFICLYVVFIQWIC